MCSIRHKFHVVNVFSDSNDLKTTVFYDVSSLKRSKKSSFIFDNLLLKIVISLFITSFSQFAYSLSTHTSLTIKGSLPYIEYNNTRIKDISELLSIKVGNTVYISDEAGNMYKKNSDGNLVSVTNISLSKPGDTFSSVKSIIVPDNNNYSFSMIDNSLIADDDGDNDFILNGNIIGQWKDSKNNLILGDLNELPTHCFGPYTLTLKADNAQLSTKYGDPSSKIYGSGIAKYIIYPHDDQPSICYAMPGSMSNNTGIFSGPTNIWDTNKGFLVQSALGRDYAQNFPTLAGDSLYFYLLIDGAKEALTWPTVKVGDITATMKSEGINRVLVTITGPIPTSNNDGAIAKKPSILPAKFTLSGINSKGDIVVKYGFVLQKWFVVRDKNIISHNSREHTNWCLALDGVPGRTEDVNADEYRLPDPVDLTSASGTFTYDNFVYNITGLNFPNKNSFSDGGRYWRHIGGGLFSEWGNLVDYGLNINPNTYYWTGKRVKQQSVTDWVYNIVRPLDGNISAEIGDTRGYPTLCFTPDWIDWL